MTVIKEFTRQENKDQSPDVEAGISQEEEVARQLSKAFSDDVEYFLFNNLIFSFDGENVEIDHLIIHKKGFLIIESKSISGEVSVNEAGEWSKRQKGAWTGINSPMVQMERQRNILLNMINHYAPLLFRKIAGLQVYRSHSDFGMICCLTNKTVIQRQHIPEEISKRIVKAEVVAMATRLFFGGRDDSSIILTKQEMNDIASLLIIKNNLQSLKSGKQLADHPPCNMGLDDFIHTVITFDPNNIQCGMCGEKEHVFVKKGWVRVYIECESCNSITPMSRS